MLYLRKMKDGIRAEARLDILDWSDNDSESDQEGNETKEKINEDENGGVSNGISRSSSESPGDNSLSSNEGRVRRASF